MGLSGPLFFDPGMCVTSVCFLSEIGVVVVGMARDLAFQPRSCQGGQLVLVDCESNEVKYVTEVEDIPGALAICGDCVAAGIGKTLRLYRLGKQHLLKRCETRAIPTFINFIGVIGNRILVGDAAEGFHFMRLDGSTDILTIFCDDCVPRFPITSVMTDATSVATGDRFGNFTLLRIPVDVSDEAEIDPSGVGMVWEHKDMSGAPNKLETISAFHVGDVMTGLSFNAGKTCLVYATVGGQIGLFIPFAGDTEVTLCRKVEAEMAKRCQRFGRSWEMFRSHYLPKRNVIDGDLLMLYLKMSSNDRETIAKVTDSTSLEISRMLAAFETYW
jgi:splicing factor 3B subunit 3